MIHLKQAVVVEGRYDKAHLASLLDTVIIETGGFRIIKDREKLAMLRAIARRRGLVILTDSDAAGFRIRRYLAAASRRRTSTTPISRIFTARNDARKGPLLRANSGWRGSQHR